MKLVKILFAALVLSTSAAHAMLGGYTDNLKAPTKYIKIGGFPDYPPFGEVKDTKHIGSFHSVFDIIIKEHSQKYRTEYIQTSTNLNYKNVLENAITGEVELLLGMYTDTDKYKSVEILFPAAIHNPIHILTLPDKAGEISDVNDLKKFKGAVHANEHVSDYIQKQFDSLNVEVVDNSSALFEKLFTGKIDYILSGRYFSIIEASKLGLKDKISFSKRPVWIMPMFFGVSQASKQKKFLAESFIRILKDPQTPQKVNDYLIEMINNIEKENRGVVPPAFLLDKQEDN